MTSLATAGDPRFSVSRSTSTVPVRRTPSTRCAISGPSEGDDVELSFITGADALAQILSWRDVPELLELACFVGVSRPGYVRESPRAAGRTHHAARDPGAGHLVHDCRDRVRRGAPLR